MRSAIWRAASQLGRSFASAGPRRSSRTWSGILCVQQRRRGRSRGDDHASIADLALLHSLIGHYARLLFDIQGTRIAVTNRVGAMQRDELAEQWYTPLVTAGDDLASTEHAINLQLTRLPRQHFLSGWIQDAPGIGLPGFARLLGVTGPLDRFDTVSRLRAYLGCTSIVTALRRAVDGASKRTGQVVCYQLAESIVRVRRGRYSEAYDRKKAEYLARPRRGPSACQFGQTHTDRQRQVLKCGLTPIELRCATPSNDCSGTFGSHGAVTAKR